MASFLYFCNLSPEGVYWSTPAWHFFLHVLHCLRVLLAGTWRVIVKKWAAPEGVAVSLAPAFLVQRTCGSPLRAQTAAFHCMLTA